MSRLVCRDIKGFKARKSAAEVSASSNSDVLSATPPLEAVRALVSTLVTRVSKAQHTCTEKCGEISYVWRNLPEGEYEEGKVAKLRKSVYWLQEASHIWQSHWGEVLRRAGAQDARGVIYSDDLLILGDGEAIKQMMRASREGVQMTGCISLEMGDADPTAPL
eukprot:275846-Amphidinium_carterae.2